jgi:hypothetical protein
VSSLDPIERYQQLRAGVTAAPDPKSLQTVIDSAKSGGGNVVDMLAEHVALHTNLTKPDATKVVEGAAKAADGTPDAGSVSNAAAAAAAAAGLSGELDLSDPVMLWPAARVVFASLLLVILGGTLWLTFHLADKPLSSQPTSSWAWVPLLVGIIASVIGVLVLVMGYKSVTIKGSGTPAAK